MLKRRVVHPKSDANVSTEGAAAVSRAELYAMSDSDTAYAGQAAYGIRPAGAVFGEPAAPDSTHAPPGP